MAAGREWFIHTIYTVRSKENANRHIGKRSVEYLQHTMSSAGQPLVHRQPRAAPAVSNSALVQDIGVENNRGTNIQHIALDRVDRMVVNQRQPWSPNRVAVLERPLLESSGRESNDTSFLPVVVGLVGLLLLICLIATIVVLLLRRMKKEKKIQTPPYSTSTCSAYQHPGNTWSSQDSSEV